jgi:hypothetical protein
MMILRMLFLACALLWIVLLPGCQQSKKDELNLQRWKDLVTRKLPMGSSRTEVEKFLDERGISHSFISKSHFPEEVNSIVALVKSKGENTIVKKDVQMKFKFNADQRLVSSECREIFTGP